MNPTFHLYPLIGEGKGLANTPHKFRSSGMCKSNLNGWGLGLTIGVVILANDGSQLYSQCEEQEDTQQICERISRK